jgi:cold shock CspA family protein
MIGDGADGLVLPRDAIVPEAGLPHITIGAVPVGTKMPSLSSTVAEPAGDSEVTPASAMRDSSAIVVDAGSATASISARRTVIRVTPKVALATPAAVTPSAKPIMADAATETEAAAPSDATAAPATAAVAPAAITASNSASYEISDAAANNGAVVRGTVYKWFEAKGFGFIEDETKRQYFVHKRDVMTVAGGQRSLYPGQTVEFQPVVQNQGGANGLQARKVSGPHGSPLPSGASGTFASLPGSPTVANAAAMGGHSVGLNNINASSSGSGAVSASPIAFANPTPSAATGARTIGTLVHWCGNKGFGFVRVEGQSADFFTHLCDFTPSCAPQVGMAIEFTPEYGVDRNRATSISLPPPPAHSSRTSPSSSPRLSMLAQAFAAPADSHGSSATAAVAPNGALTRSPLAASLLSTSVLLDAATVAAFPATAIQSKPTPQRKLTPQPQSNRVFQGIVCEWNTEKGQGVISFAVATPDGPNESEELRIPFAQRDVMFDAALTAAGCAASAPNVRAPPVPSDVLYEGLVVEFRRFRLQRQGVDVARGVSLTGGAPLCATAAPVAAPAAVLTPVAAAEATSSSSNTFAQQHQRQVYAEPTKVDDVAAAAATATQSMSAEMLKGYQCGYAAATSHIQKLLDCMRMPLDPTALAAAIQTPEAVQRAHLQQLAVAFAAAVGATLPTASASPATAPVFASSARYDEQQGYHRGGARSPSNSGRYSNNSAQPVGGRQQYDSHSGNNNGAGAGGSGNRSYRHDPYSRGGDGKTYVTGAETGRRNSDGSFASSSSSTYERSRPRHSGRRNDDGNNGSGRYRTQSSGSGSSSNGGGRRHAGNSDSGSSASRYTQRSRSAHSGSVASVEKSDGTAGWAGVWR